VTAAFCGHRRQFLARRALGNGILRDRRPASRMFGFLLSLCVGLVPGGPSHAGPARELGILHPFYRATQLQGQLIGMGLLDIPDYLTGPDIDLKYAAKPGMARGAVSVVLFSPASEEMVMDDATVPYTDPTIDVDHQIFPTVSSRFELSGRGQLFSGPGSLSIKKSSRSGGRVH